MDWKKGEMSSVMWEVTEALALALAVVSGGTQGVICVAPDLFSPFSASAAAAAEARAAATAEGSVHVS